MNHTPLALVIALCLASPLAAETALEIASGFDKQKIAALEKYLADQPEAEDRDLAISILVGAHIGMGEFAPVPDLLVQRYELQDKGPDADLQTIINEITRPLIESSTVSDQRDKAKEFLARVKADLAEHPQGAQVGQFLDQLGAQLYLPGVGDEMKIAFTDLAGKEIDLGQMEDKVVLVDFWATWCGPCVAEMPHLVAAYEAYREKGFEIVGISLDEDKAAVEGFLAERGITWPQHFDGKGWQNEIAQNFGITGIPATFLVGKGGKIVASNLRGKALDKAIEEALAGE